MKSWYEEEKADDHKMYVKIFFQSKVQGRQSINVYCQFQDLECKSLVVTFTKTRKREIDPRGRYWGKLWAHCI